MAKAKTKTKKCPIGTTATEWKVGEVSVGWSFQTPHFEWRWETSAGVGLNLMSRPADSSPASYVRMLFAKDLNHAVMFAHGYDAGRSFKGAVPQEDQPEGGLSTDNPCNPPVNEKAVEQLAQSMTDGYWKPRPTESTATDTNQGAIENNAEANKQD